MGTEGLQTTGLEGGRDPGPGAPGRAVAAQLRSEALRWPPRSSQTRVRVPASGLNCAKGPARAFVKQ